MTYTTYSTASYAEKTTTYALFVAAQVIPRKARALVSLRAAVLLCGLFFLAACGNQGPATFTLHGEALGTFYTITVVAPPADITEIKARQLADTTLDLVNRLMSTYLEDSELSRFNGHDAPVPFPVSQETQTVFEIAREISQQSGGAFDVTVGPLVNAWGFGPDAFKNPPDETAIKALLQHTGYEKITLHPGPAISKAHPDVYCDLSAIAKGYAVDAFSDPMLDNKDSKKRYRADRSRRRDPCSRQECSRRRLDTRH